MTKTFCDICEKQIREVSVNHITITVNYAEYPQENEVCESCYKHVKEEFRKLKLKTD